jgi:ribose transport system substrate-binding protein
MKKFLLIGLASMLLATQIVGCSSGTTGSTSTAANVTTADTVATAAATTADKPYIALIAKGFQAQYWQVVKKGAEDAATKLGADITFEGPATESDIQQQVDMINADISKKPKALGLAVLDTKSVASQLQQCKSVNIPVIGFDSGVPGDTSGALVATAATDNGKAAALAADSMFADANFLAAIKTGTAANPVVIGLLSQDATSASITQRSTGFIDEMIAKLQTLDGLSGAVKVQGQANYNKDSASPAKVIIQVNIPPSTSATDVENGAQTLLGTKNIVALFGSNQTTADGILAATNDGTDLDKTNGKYKSLIVAGFDAGKGQKAAVSKGWFIGSITQDPYTIGYDTVKIAMDAISGKTVADTDTGAKWYTAATMTDPSIAQLLYD